MIARSGFRFKECAVIVFTIRRCTSLVVAHSEAYACIGVPFMVVIIEVNPGIATTLSVSTDFRTTKVSTATVLLEHDIDDTGCAFRTEFSWRIGNYFDTLDSVTRNLFKDLSTVVGCQTWFFTINPNCHWRVTTEWNLTFLVNLYRRNWFEQFTCWSTCSGDIGIDCKDTTVEFKSHLRLHTGDNDFLKHLCVISKVDFTDIDNSVIDSDISLLWDITEVGNTNYVFTIRHFGKCELTIFVSVCAISGRFTCASIDKLHHSEIDSFARLFIAYMSCDGAISKN